MMGEREVVGTPFDDQRAEEQHRHESVRAQLNGS